MQFSFSVLTTFCVALSAAHALLLNTPVNAVESQQLQVTWIAQPGDTAFNLQLKGFTIPDIFLFATNVDPSLDSLVVTVPCNLPSEPEL